MLCRMEAAGYHPLNPTTKDPQLVMTKLKYIITLGILLTTVTSCVTSSSTMDNKDLQREYTEEYDEVYNQAVNTVTTLAWDLKQTEKESGLIQAETPASAFTSGDEVTIRITDGDNEKVKVDIISASNQAFDWGKDEQNIRKFYEKMDELLGRQQE